MAAKGKVLTAEDIKALQKQIAENKKREEEEEKEREAEKLAKKQGKEYVPTYSNKKVTATADQMANAVNSKIKWLQFSQALGRPQTDDEVWTRINDFWKICAETGEVPQKSDFYMYMNISPQMFQRWKAGEGCSSRRAEMMAMFDEMYNSVRDTLANQGLIEKISYIWQSKNHQGYREPKQEYEITNSSPMVGFNDIQTIENKYGNDLMLGDGEDEE